MTGTDTFIGDSTFVPLTLRRRGVQRVVQAPTGAHESFCLDGSGYVICPGRAHVADVGGTQAWSPVWPGSGSTASSLLSNW